MAGGNGRRGLWLPPGTESVRANDLHEVMTVGEWLRKPLAPATRGEVAAFGQALVQNQVRDLLREVLNLYEARVRAIIREEVEEEAEARRARRWYRRLARWLRGIGAVGGMAQSTGSSVAARVRESPNVTATSSGAPTPPPGSTAPEPTAPAPIPASDQAQS